MGCIATSYYTRAVTALMLSVLVSWAVSTKCFYVKAELCIAPSLMRRVKERVSKLKIDDAPIMTCAVLT